MNVASAIALNCTEYNCCVCVCRATFAGICFVVCVYKGIADISLCVILRECMQVCAYACLFVFRLPSSFFNQEIWNWSLSKTYKYIQRMYLLDSGIIWACSVPCSKVTNTRLDVWMCIVFLMRVCVRSFEILLFLCTLLRIVREPNIDSLLFTPNPEVTFECLRVCVWIRLFCEQSIHIILFICVVFFWNVDFISRLENTYTTTICSCIPRYNSSLLIRRISE